MILITNNPKVNEDKGITCKKRYLNGSYMDVLITARDMIHKGHQLLSHPLSGSVKPGETPFKSIIISETTASLDMESLNIIEDSINLSKSLMGNSRKYGYNNQENLMADFSEIDYTLITSALKSAVNK